VAERFIVPVNLGYAGGEKGPWVTGNDALGSERHSQATWQYFFANLHRSLPVLPFKGQASTLEPS
jgi:hypothetical protein